MQQLTLHATSWRFALGASDFCVVSENSTRAPSQHCRDATVYGHTTTAPCIIMSTPNFSLRIKHARTLGALACVGHLPMSRFTCPLPRRGRFPPLRQPRLSPLASMSRSLNCVVLSIVLYFDGYSPGGPIVRRKQARRSYRGDNRLGNSVILLLRR